MRQDESRQQELELDKERDSAENQQVHEQLDRLEEEWNKLLN